MSNSKKLAMIAIGYVLSAAVGFAAAAVNEAFMPDDVAQGSPGMVAFGDMILFIFVTGFFSLAPTWFLLKLLVATAPRTLLTAELLIAAMGPVSWLAVTIMALTAPPGGPSLQNMPQAAAQLFGLFLAFGAIPRMVLGPVFMVIEGVTFLLLRGGVARALLAGAMLMDVVPVGLYALHFARTVHY
ncbi:MAG: hypothetical protein JO320_15945 [Alphaproteobacteria bacterium]|nr:hypothetical protein [Alphaproteobacteria bacterium]